MSKYSPKPPGIKIFWKTLIKITIIIDKGSFPLDHFHECDDFAKVYNECVVKH